MGNINNINKDILNKILIPLGQGTILAVLGAIIGGLASSIANLDFVSYGALCGLVVMFFWLFVEYSSIKNLRPWDTKKPTKLMKLASDITSMNNLKQPNIVHTTNILIQSPDGKEGDYFRVEGISEHDLKRVCFYVWYGNGKFSYQYLHEDKRLLTRPEVNTLQDKLRNASLIEKKNPSAKTSGWVLNPNGKKVFFQLAKCYPPTLEEKKSLVPEFKRYTQLP